ncbi:hypothetical protein D0Y60_23180 [Shinella sp. WSJ-2]|uniref:hypothetical protein n=1 Tax=Shinella sp. WSJ-2 TaxID=2303749 RepID=UPI000E3C7D52|nr:hypothetical protein [Shinella sp. WSJ-2]RFZ81967.1 hypothetical protein D0Y60_23180 [Shinella sp. WSJ-2]
MPEKRGNFTEGLRVFKTDLGWCWELYDRRGKKIGRSMLLFPSKGLCLENAMQHGMTLPPDEEHDVLDDMQFDEAAIRADIKLIEAVRAERQRLSPSGFSEGGDQELKHKSYVYIVSSPPRNALIVRVDTDLPDILSERRKKSLRGATPEHQMETLVWYAIYDTFEDALLRQKAIQKWPRQRKIGFIEALNPEWADISHLIAPLSPPSPGTG